MPFTRPSYCEMLIPNFLSTRFRATNFVPSHLSVEISPETYARWGLKLTESGSASFGHVELYPPLLSLLSSQNRANGNILWLKFAIEATALLRNAKPLYAADLEKRSSVLSRVAILLEDYVSAVERSADSRAEEETGIHQPFAHISLVDANVKLIFETLQFLQELVGEDRIIDMKDGVILKEILVSTLTRVLTPSLPRLLRNKNLAAQVLLQIDK